MSEQNVNTLKCANCNIVISELLSFIQNKISVMDNESLIRICATAFSEEEVECAKNLLFSSIKTNLKKVSRRKKWKNTKRFRGHDMCFQSNRTRFNAYFCSS
ncbi:unnamed protein product [Euphydryas editha]|uniref:Saposin B-type domain-containing protein n=1 Tax=Euphydryas editha TaxID=104508 RepID=A0AAU9UI96_EUPED|nr:unnamed protein product [Euphydryas editha]